MEKKSVAPAKSAAKEVAAATCRERRRGRMKFLKAIMIVAVLVTALGLGSCAKKEETVTTTAGTTGYSK
jgi:hypothetical protein